MLFAKSWRMEISTPALVAVPVLLSGKYKGSSHEFTMLKVFSCGSR